MPEINSGAALVDMAMGYFRSRAVCAAARLEVPDALSSGPLTVAQIADHCGADANSLHRLLRALASIGIVREAEPGVFALTAMGEPLRRYGPDSVWPGVVFWADLLADSWSQLTDCIRTGDTAQRVMERAGASPLWARDPDGGAIFHAVMGTASAEAYEPIAQSWDFSPWRTIADLGGGGGGLLVAVLRSSPGLRGMLVDRPAAVKVARARFDEEGLGAACEFVSMDVLQKVPAGADVYMMKHVLHGYDDDRAVQILQNCREALPVDGRLLIIEFVIPAVVEEADAELERCLMSDLNMLAVTGGKERTAAEWTGLLERAGLRLAGMIPVEGDPVSVIEVSR